MNAIPDSDLAGDRAQPEPGTQSVLDRASGLVQGRLGLRPDPSLRSRLDRCLRDEAAATGEDLGTYVDRLVGDGVARQKLFDRVTVQETAFFRHPGQFESLAQMLPGLTAPVTIWSAGCSNGQEPYSLAMVLDELGIVGTVFATDVSTSALERATEASYSIPELNGLSAARRARYLEGSGATLRIRPQVRDRVVVRHHNLATDPMPEFLGRCQIVFCRNVLIYFSTELISALMARLAEGLQPGASLFLGYAEPIWQLTDLFEPVRTGDAYQYHRRRCAEARPIMPGPAMPGPAQPSRRIAPSPKPPNSAPSRPRTARRAAEATDWVDQAVGLRRAGQAAAAAGDLGAAIAAFRKWAYLAPDEPMAHLHLGLALEAGGDPVPARRAFRAARAAIARCDNAAVERDLEGYGVDDLIRLLDGKQSQPRNRPATRLITRPTNREEQP